ncbi:MAG TPA: hypothetical protein VEW95_09275 [Candidatus Limnocylindrales bacterium]|nr:hypothetical protein [Candidatus Limnocylindrales bacterium]
MADLGPLATALQGALDARDGRIDWSGAYDHGQPPSVEQIARSMAPRLEKLLVEIINDLDEEEPFLDGKIDDVDLFDASPRNVARRIVERLAGKDPADG